MAKGQKPKYTVSELQKAFAEYKKIRDIERLPYTQEGFLVYIGLSVRTWQQYQNDPHYEGYNEPCQCIKAEMIASLVDNAIIEKNTISKWLIGVHNRDYVEQTKQEVDNKIEINIKRV